MRWGGCTAAVGALALTVAACGGGGGDGDAEASADTTTTLDADERAVLEAYEGAWDARLAANDPPNPAHHDLTVYATGEFLDSLVFEAEQNLADGEVMRVPEPARYEHRATVQSVEGDTATVRDCLVDDLAIINASTGAVVNDAVATYLSYATVVREAGAWKVASVTEEQRWDGVAGCATDEQ